MAGRSAGLAGEIATADEVDAEGVEIARSGHVQFSAGSGIQGLLANSLKAVAAVAAGKRKRIGDGGRRDAGNGGSAALEFGEELDGVLGCVAVQARIDGHGENAAGTKANINAGGAAKTAEAETGDAEKNERHGDLRDDEDVA